MSTLKMQESTQDDTLVKLRQQAVDKGEGAILHLSTFLFIHGRVDIRYATLENELLKKNEELLSVKATFNETLGKVCSSRNQPLHTLTLQQFRKEADRVMKLESELNRQAEVRIWFSLSLCALYIEIKGPPCRAS